jgi:GH15 family glucan-1,4-alpha-glucosidase
MAEQHIDDYGVIGDLHTAALVGRSGSIDWLCMPRFDSDACFASVLGDDRAGHWRVAPRSAGPCTRRRYRDHALILESEWETGEGTVRVVDFMPERDDTPNLVRIVEGVSGSVRMSTSLVIRFGYGRVLPWVRRRGDELVAIAGPDCLVLSTPVRLQPADHRHAAEFTVSAGERVPFVLTWRPSNDPRSDRFDPEEALTRTERLWADWLSGCEYEGEWKAEVIRSLMLLKALTYAPTGGIVAAATTSLPEQLGGGRNWDYRFCWLRDATMTLEALLYSGYVEEAKAWREWLLRAVAGDAAELQIMYGICGERRLPEYTLDWLPGFAGSVPVRAGNAAVGQFQLDVYGEVMDALHVGRMSGIAAHDDAWSLQIKLMDFLESHWQEPDEGLWEVRGPRRHFVHSKVMAWVAADRAARAVENGGVDGPADRWRRLRDEIHGEVCRKGYDADRNTFVQCYGTDDLDAALLLIPQVGFLPPDDPRVAGTVDAILSELGHDEFVRRYDPGSGVDGLPGGEGAFVACSFWLAEDLGLIGRREEGRRRFQRALGLANDLGILSEGYDPVRRVQLGNTPQAFSHVALVHAARVLGARRPSGSRQHPERHHAPGTPSRDTV